MGSGNRRVKMNNLERLLSTDINRMQDMQAAQLGNLMKYWVNLRTFYPEVNNSIAVEPFEGLPSSPIADIFDGLMVAPQIASTSIRVLAGVLGTREPDSPLSTDDSSYKIVYDRGISTDGQLVLTPNASGQTRIDVIECQRVESVEEMDSRDIFNLITGLFAPALVDKVKKSSLAYRIRVGTPGGGYPGTVQGWLPLAVASVPTGTVNCDTVCFWDVRPLVVDRVWAPKLGGMLVPHPPTQLDVVGTWEISGSVVRLYGLAWTNVLGSIAGGRLTKGVGVANEAYINSWDAQNYEPSFAPAANTLIYLWFLFPEFLPRWVRYSGPALGTRIPVGTRGIPVLSTKGPSALSNLLPSAAVSLPTITGLTNPAIIGACPFAFTTEVGTALPATFACDGAWIYPSFTSLTASTVPYTGAGLLTVEAYRLLGGTHFPIGARALKVRVQCTISGGVGVTYQFQGRPALRDGIGTTMATGFGMNGGSVTTIAGGAAQVYLDFEVPVSNPWAAQGAEQDCRVEVNWNFTGGTKSAESCRVLAWKMG